MKQNKASCLGRGRRLTEMKSRANTIHHASILTYGGRFRKEEKNVRIE